MSFLKKISPSIVKKIVIVALLTIPIVISFIDFEVPRRLFGNVTWLRWITIGTRTVSLRPTLLPTLAAVALYLSIIVRFKANVFKKPYEVLIAALNILLCASFLTLFVGETQWLIFTIDSRAFLVVAIALSWLGMRSIAGFVWVGLFLLATFRMFAVDEAMDIWGAVYILTAFLGLGLQLGNYIHNIADLKSDFMGVGAKIGGDIRASADVAVKIVSVPVSEIGKSDDELS